MKAAFEDIPSKKKEQSFLAYTFTNSRFRFKWHYHPEYELTLITQGKGKRLIGDHYGDYTTGDLVLIGSNLPHTWNSNKITSRKSSATVIQFSPAFISVFAQLPEFESVQKLLVKCAQGLFFPLSKKEDSLAAQISCIPTQSGVEKVTALLTVLQELTTRKYKSLSSNRFQVNQGSKHEKRINLVCNYIQEHSTEKFELSQVAGLIHLSTSAFCKFFKRITGKTFSDYVNEVRIGHACQLLIESDKPISDVAFEAGFESLTYFNRIFLKKKHMRPKEFRANRSN